MPKRHGPTPLGLVSIHLQLLASDLDYLRQMRESGGKPVNEAIRELVSGYVEWIKRIEDAEKQIAANSMRKGIESAASENIVAENEGEVKLQPYMCPECGGLEWKTSKNGGFQCSQCKFIVTSKYMQEMSERHDLASTTKTIPGEAQK